MTGCVNLRGDTLHLLKDARVIILDNCTQITDDQLIDFGPRFNVISLKNTGITGRFFEHFYSCTKQKMCWYKHHVILDENEDYMGDSVCIDDCVNFDQQYHFYLVRVEVMKVWS